MQISTMRSVTLGMFLAWAGVAAASTNVADAVYRHGLVYTVDARQPRADAVAVTAGRIVFVGSDRDVVRFIGPATRVIDLNGHLVIPGLIDGHLHPIQGGLNLLKCSLDYERLTVEQFQARIQACLDAHPQAKPDEWLEVVDWFRYDMIPKGVSVSRQTLDALHTQRPILVSDSFGHSSLANSRALALAGYRTGTPDPIGGRINRDASGAPTGMLEDSAQEPLAALLPQPTAKENVAAARAAQAALNRQGVTSFLDAIGDPDDIAAFAALKSSGELSIRAHFAPRIRPEEAQDAAHANASLARVVAIARESDQGPAQPSPSITVRNVKLFLDGVITAPANTGALVGAYFENHGTVAAPHFEPAKTDSPSVYFPAPILAQLLIGLGKAGIDPHMHADGDGAVRAGLDAVAALRRALPGRDIRPALAHCELVHPDDYGRFAALHAIPVLSFQWEKPAADTIEGARDSLGAERHARIEPAGVLAARKAPIAFGSDWPVDRLDEWYALKVGVTRTAGGDPGPEHQGRLGADPGLSREAVLHAITMGAAYELHQDGETGSLSVGKFADLAVLDQNVLTVPAEQIAQTHVLRTVVGGKTVYDAGQLREAIGQRDAH